MKHLTLILMSLLILASCGKTPTANVKISGAFAVGADSFTGGAVLLASTVINGKVETFSVPMANDEISFELPIGNYNLMTLGWDGTNALTGNIYCDAKEAVAIDSDIDLRFNLVSMGSPIAVTHNCASFIEGDLVELQTLKICSENNSTGTCGESSSYVSKDSSGSFLSIKYGIIPHAGAPIFSHPSMLSSPKTVAKTSGCIANSYIDSVPQGNVDDIAKINFTISNGALNLPNRLKKGLRLPFTFSIYDGDGADPGCTNEDYFSGAAVLGNSIGELDVAGTPRHEVGVNSIYRIPTFPLEYATINTAGITLAGSGTNTMLYITNIGLEDMQVIPQVSFDGGQNWVDLKDNPNLVSTGSNPICAPGSDCVVTIVAESSGIEDIKFKVINTNTGEDDKDFKITFTNSW